MDSTTPVETMQHQEISPMSAIAIPKADTALYDYPKCWAECYGTAIFATLSLLCLLSSQAILACCSLLNRGSPATVSRPLRNGMIPYQYPNQSGSVPEPAIPYSRCLLDIQKFFTTTDTRSASREKKSDFRPITRIIDRSADFQYFAVS
ncbi:MAG: hypothetical protein ABFS45_24965 [Pseudomonadota bacterium]